MHTNIFMNTSFLENPQVYFTVLLTIKRSIPEIAEIKMRPSELKEYLDSHNHPYSADMISHISSRYADIICYLETQDLIDTIASNNGYDYNYVDTESIFACMDQLLMESVFLDRFPSDLNVNWAIHISDGILSAGIIYISDSAEDYRVNAISSHQSYNNFN